MLVEVPDSQPKSATDKKLLFKRRHQFSQSDLKEQLSAVSQVKVMKQAPRSINSKLEVVFKRRHWQSGEDLRKQLFSVPEIKIAKGELALVKEQLDKQLPVQKGADCYLGREPAQHLSKFSGDLRNLIDNARGKNGLNITRIRNTLLDTEYAKPWWVPEAVPTFVQMLQAEDKPIRKVLVELLAKIKHPTSTKALVDRALFELSREIREEAVQALAKRDPKDFRQPLLEGLEYPWAPVADHAAETLVALQDTAAIPKLTDLLERKSWPDGQEHTVKELVKINHLSNCNYCHAQSTSKNDLVRGAVPTPGQPLPSAQYYSNSDVFVRADVTYLRQDFSVTQPVLKPNKWPSFQRFDYVIRTSHIGLPALKMTPYRLPEHTKEAAQFALRELQSIEQAALQTQARLTN